MRSLDSFLELGLIGMARGGRHGWFYAHFGAAFLAGYFMNQEHELPEHVKQGIERICEGFRRNNPEWYTPLLESREEPHLLERLVTGIQTNTERLRTSGHGLALGVLALKALRQRPELITAEIVDGLVHVLELTTQDRQNRYWGIDNYFEVTEPDVRPFVPPIETLSIWRNVHLKSFIQYQQEERSMASCTISPEKPSTALRLRKHLPTWNASVIRTWSMQA